MTALTAALAVTAGLFPPGAWLAPRPIPTDSYTAVRLHPIRGCPLMWVECEIDGRPVKLIVDTGAAATCIVPAVAKRLGVKLVPTRQVPIGTALATQYGAAGVRLRVGATEREHFRAEILDLSAVLGEFEKTIGVEFDGLLGADFLRQHDAILDLKTNRLLLRDTPAEERAALRGEWRATVRVHHGEQDARSPDVRDSRLELTATRFTLRIGELVWAGVWTTNPGARPRTLMLTMDVPKNGTERPAVQVFYERDGDRLRILTAGPNTPPDKLESTAANKLTLWTFERVAVETAPPPRPAAR